MHNLACTGTLCTYDTTLEDVEGDDRFEGYTSFIMMSVDGAPDDDMLREYHSNFKKKWLYSAKKNGVDFTLGQMKTVSMVFFNNKQGIKGYDNHKRINRKEYYWFERCANNGLFYLKKDGIETECTTYDRISCYANILGSDVIIPTRPGKNVKLKCLPDNIATGFYHVKITCQNKDFSKCFIFSKCDVYVDISLKFAMKYREQFGIEFELIQDGEPNAYLYSAEDTVPLKSVTELWHKRVTRLKKNLPKNPLIKFLSSATWGCITQTQTKLYTYDQMQDMDIGPSIKNDYRFISREFKDDVEYYKIVDTKHAYKYKLRLKPWVTAQARNDLGELASQHLDNVIRAQTDSISFNKDIKLKDNRYKIEDKTTGLIHFKNLNSYYNKTNGYKSRLYK